MPAPRDDRLLSRLMALSQVGMEMVVPMALGILVDYWLGTMPLLTVVGALLGLVGGVTHLIYLNRPRV